MTKTRKKSLAADFRAAKRGGTELTGKQKQLRAMIKKARKNGVTIGSAKQTHWSAKKSDRQLRALPPGARISKNGNLYYESRRNRSDKRSSLL